MALSLPFNDLEKRRSREGIEKEKKRKREGKEKELRYLSSLILRKKERKNEGRDFFLLFL